MRKKYLGRLAYGRQCFALIGSDRELGCRPGVLGRTFDMCMQYDESLWGKVRFVSFLFG